LLIPVTAILLGWLVLGEPISMREIAGAIVIGSALIVIDGRARPACLHHALPRLKKDGMILFANSHRRPYRRAIAEAPLKAIRTRGLTACLPYPDETTLLQRA